MKRHCRCEPPRRRKRTDRVGTVLVSIVLSTDGSNHDAAVPNVTVLISR
jgi:hypothetical protein